MVDDDITKRMKKSYSRCEQTDNEEYISENNISSHLLLCKQTILDDI